MSWEQAKRAALERDTRCQRCGDHDTLDVHHRRARGMGGTQAKDRLSNLLTLCRACHNTTEAHPVDARALGYRLDADQEPDQTPLWAFTVNGPGWWRLGDDGSTSWVDIAP